MSNNDREAANEDMAVAAAEASTERRQKGREEKREEGEQRKADLIKASLDAATVSREKRKKK
jgi:hypothetical protein